MSPKEASSGHFFSNDLPTTVSSSHAFLFTDDTKCLQTVRSSSDCHSLQNDLQNLFYWSQYWNLHFNERKCILLRFSPKCPHIPFNYSINDKPIATLEHYRELGVIMSHNLSWSEHLKYISSRAYKFLGLTGVLSVGVTFLGPKRFFTYPSFAHSLHIVHRFGDLTFLRI